MTQPISGRSPAEILDDLRMWVVLEFFLGTRAQDAALSKAEGMTHDQLSRWAWQLTMDGKVYTGSRFQYAEPRFDYTHPTQEGTS